MTIPCHSEFYADAPIGMKREMKTELVPRPDLIRQIAQQDTAEAEAILSPYLVDGWQAREEDFFNPNRWKTGPNGEQLVAVSFYRWVENEG